MKNNPIKSDIHSELHSVDIPEYIDRPEYVKNKWAGFSLQILGWSLWMWLIMPLFTILLWWFEGQNIYKQLFLSLNNNGRYSLYMLVSCIMVLIMILFVWASYNWIRFYNVQRRNIPEPATEAQIAQSFNLNVCDIHMMKSSKNITIHFDDDGNLVKYETTA
ncbi:poly-beta-1,6-N-acetyl-D-glucosamine biosynthesis protein PgaD [Acinetobacter sp. WU_MDCI_Axc73]|nr:poly-beta-1,6-N-acetyl-D-glucosamine biosynthesis protein PgaD [Acinetobacter sp. WU_MDCI_Axc73]